MTELPAIEPSPAARADAAALAALELVPPATAGEHARTLALASLAAAALIRSRAPSRCLGRALARHLAERRASRHDADALPARPTRDEVAALAGPIAAAVRAARRFPPPGPAAMRRAEDWCRGRGDDREDALAGLVCATLHAAPWTGAEPGLVLSAALARLPGPPRTGEAVLEDATGWALREDDRAP
ncbi:MAG TPA: hypothetical protein VNT51_04310 [Miltoncostaeaceae bacterium]|nr:hypothetical protein [Miltoncostaeaceae bacterium]